MDVFTRAIRVWHLNHSLDLYLASKVKQGLYRKYNFNLIELGDEAIKNLDDCLQKMLLKFGVEVS
jgi:hypothetical protein